MGQVRVRKSKIIDKSIFCSISHMSISYYVNNTISSIILLLLQHYYYVNSKQIRPGKRQYKISNA